MAHRTHQKVVYYTNRAVEAIFTGNSVLGEKYTGMLAANGSPNALHQGYLLFVRSMPMKNPEQRVQQLRAAHDCFLEAAAFREAAMVLIDVGRVVDIGRPALVEIHEAARLFDKAGDGIGKSKALLNMGRNYLHLQNFDEACKVLYSSIEIQRQTGDLVGMGIALLNLAAAYLSVGEFGRALGSAQESISCFERNTFAVEQGSETAGEYLWQTNGWKRIPGDTSSYLANAYVNYGNALDFLGDQDTAIAAFLKANELMSNTQDICGKAMVLNQIGQILLENGELQGAEEYFRESVALFEQAGSGGYMYGQALQSVGQACSAQQKFQQAVEFYTSAITEFTGAAHKLGEAETLLLIGEVEILKEEYKAALPFLQQSLAIGRSVSALDIVVRSNRALGSALMHIDSAAARTALMNALLLAEEQAMKPEQQNIHRELSFYYKLIGESADALSHFEKFYALQREIHTERAEQSMRNFEVLHRIEQYRNSLSAMEQKVQQISSELEAKTNELATLAVRIMEKQEFVKLVEKGLNRILKSQPDGKDKLALQLLESINKADTLQSDWEDLIKRFLSVHQEFAERLMQVAPTITSMEFRVCVLARLSMGAKQIADVLNIEPKTVFNHQGNIRRKLKLTDGKNLKTHLIRLESGSE